MATAKKQNITIRPATALDSVNIVRLIKAGYAETPATQIGDVDDQKLLEYVNTTIGAAQHAAAPAFVIVADQQGRLLGSLGVAPIRVPWCNAVMMAETWFAVTAAYRAKRVPEQLLEVVERLMDQQKLVGFMGSQMLTPAALDEVIAKRSAYQVSRQTFLRLPLTATRQRAVGA